MAQQPPVGQGPLFIEDSLSHSVTGTTLGRTPQTSDQTNTMTSTWQHTTLTRDRNPCPRRDSNSQS